MLDSFGSLILGLVLGAVAGIWFTLCFGWINNDAEVQEYKIQIEQLKGERDTYKQLVLDKLIVE